MAIDYTADIEKKVLDICRRLKRIREDKGLSQRDVAYSMGMAQPNYQRLEKGKYVPKISTLYTWAQAVGYKLELDLAPDPSALTRALEDVFGNTKK